MNTTDGELLARYARDRSETAFAELVRRHINVIYSAALRQVNGDAHLAEDVTQSVFTDLACKAAKLTRHTSLTGWLYTSTRFVAANLRRTEQRRNVREQEAHTMKTILSSAEPEPDWARIRPLLDDAMHELDDQDRELLLLRHFENRSYPEIGGRFGVTENAARMRVERALEKLHGILAKRGVTSATMALAGLLTANTVGAVPTHLAAKVSRTAQAGAGTTSGLFLLLASKVKLAAAIVAAAAAVTWVVTSRHAGSETSNDVVAATAPINPTTETSSNTALPENSPAVSPLPSPVTNGPVLQLEIVTADTGKPIPSVPLDYRGWAAGKFKGKQVVSDRFGRCNVSYPANISELELTTRKDGFADTQLLWRPPNGDVIPTNYLLRVDRATPISGRVVDEEGNPIAGATVGWNHDDDPAAVKLPQSHRFSWEETTTDRDGNWRIDRIAEDMISLIYGGASHSNYVGSPMILAARDKSVEKQLREGTWVFKLGRATTINGIVVDADQTLIPNATVLVGYYGMSGSRTGKSERNGTFSVAGCGLGKQLVSAEAAGFAATSVEVDVSENAEPVRLTLKPGKLLRLRVVDNAGHPIPKANIWHNNFNQGPIDPNRPKPVQVQFNPTTDGDGRAVLTNAPDTEMKFDVQASGYQRANGVEIRPDGEEHTITLRKAPAVHGAVSDEVTGQPIPHFRIALGWPEWDPIENTTNAVWSTIGRFWLDYANGAYSNRLEEAVLGGTKNRGWILKFTAEGYAPFVSRVIEADEGDVELNVILRRANAPTVTAYGPGNKPAANADVGLVFPGSRLGLIPGGFSRENIQTGGSLLRTKADGTFELAPDDAITRVIVASPDGYAEATLAVLSANPIIQLQAWGRLEVTCLSGGKPAAGYEYELSFGSGSPETVSFDYEMSHVKADAQGRFSVSQMPPGQHELNRIYPQAMGNFGGWFNGAKTSFEIRPGETTTLTLGGSNYTVTARLQWPDGFQRQPQWRIMGSLHTPMPAIPQAVLSDETAREAFMQTDEFKAAQANAHAYQAPLNNDNTLSADDVPAGAYVFDVTVLEWPWRESGKRIKNLFHGSVSVTVPADPPTGNLDAGMIELQPGPDSP